MPYETLPNTMKSGRRSPEWTNEPCLGLNRCTISFNTKAVELLKLEPGQFLFLLADIASNKLAVKRPIDGNTDGAYRLQWCGSGKSRKPSGAMEITSKRPATTFPDAVGKLFRPTINAELKLIEIEIDKPIAT